MHAYRVARVSQGTLYRDLGDGVVLLQLDLGEYFGLQGMAYRVWQLLVENGRLEDLEEQLLSEYSVPREQLRADVEAFVQDLVKNGLVTVDTEGDGGR